MAMELKLPDDPRSKKLLGAAAAFALIVGLYWWFMWKPDHAEVVAIAAHADSLEEANAVIRKLVADGEEARVKAASARYTAELTALRRLVPTTSQVVALIDGVSTAARQNGMDISDYAPDGEMPGDYFDARKYRFSVTGPYHRVAQFLTDVGSLDRIIVPINVNITPSARRIERRPGKDETFVDVNFGLLTYVSKTVAPAPPAR
jgi:type IV pilus assembly protein PilO